MTFSSDHKLDYPKELVACVVINDTRDPEWNMTLRPSLTARGIDDLLDVADGNSIARFMGALAVPCAIYQFVVVLR